MKSCRKHCEHIAYPSIVLKRKHILGEFTDKKSFYPVEVNLDALQIA
jgi:hypothetical protein